jgi:two-component system chemotaxis sensor kinase CheA
MKNLSVKVKTLIIMIALSVLSLGVFAYLTFNSYKKDKLAFVYDHLSSVTQSQSTLLSTTVGSYHLFLGSIISGLDFKTRSLAQTHAKFLKQNRQILGLYTHMSDHAEYGHMTLFEASGIEQSKDWNNIEQAPMGLSLINGKEGIFLLKKPLPKSGYAALSFKQLDLSDLFNVTPDRASFIYNIKQVGSGTAVGTLAQHKATQDKIKNMPLPFGLIETTVNGEKYFVSFSKLSFQDLILVNMIKEKKVLLIQDVFLKQVVLFLTLIASVSLLIGTLSARWLTWHLDTLKNAAQNMENGDFDSKIEIESNDELGTLGMAFNSMGDKIKFLMDELKYHNQELELRVKERTLELQELTDIQKAMLNSLGQGFVIINKDFKVHPVYSKIAEEMFETRPDQTGPGVIMGIKEEETQNFKDLFEMAFNQVLDFDDVAKLNPEYRSNSKNQKIFLNYAPIKNSESGSMEYVLVIGTDKTAEIESMEKFKKEWNFSQMISKIASNRNSVNKIISESLNMLSAAMKSLETEKDFAIREVQRLVHTIKGSVSYFYIEEITNIAHDFESFLTPHYDTKTCTGELKTEIAQKIFGLQIAIECYIDHYNDIVQYKDSMEKKSISIKELEAFSTFLDSNYPNVGKVFRNKFFTSTVSDYFEMYPGVVDELGKKLNKKATFTLVGGGLQLPEGNWDELFQQFIHVIRNAMDHGLESPEVRVAQGKPAVGQIKFSFAVAGDMLHINLTDDGQGIDWKKIAAKDPTIKSEQDALERIKTGGVSSKDEVSDTSGRGAGVSSVFWAVEKLGGKIEFINCEKKGTSLVITMPLSPKKELQWPRSA